MGLFGRKKKEETPFVTVVIAAAGASRRMGGENKQLILLDGIPVLGRTLLAFQQSPYIREIILAAAEEHMAEYAALGRQLKIDKLTRVIRGGESRLESVYRAACEASPDCEYLAVHDGARPLVSQQVIEDVCKAAFLYSAAGPGVPVTDTIKRIDGADHALETVDRGALRAMQTPQMAEKPLLLAALQSALEAGAETTDELAALERMGMRPVIVPGDRENIKLTTPTDVLVANAILAGREQA